MRNAAKHAPKTDQSSDAANVSDTMHQYAYDAENRIATVGDAGVSYIYDADGRRVGKSNGTTYVVMPDGSVLDELQNGQWIRSEIDIAGHHLATLTPSGVVFTHGDWIGKERARTDAGGSLCEAILSQPFGDNQQKTTPAGATGCDPTPDFFTGKQRDQESNLDQFEARYLSSQWGRWMSPDWSAKAATVPYANMGNPQSLNLYAYVGNDPVSGEDPDGHAVYPFGDGLSLALDALPAHNEMLLLDAMAPASARSAMHTIASAVMFFQERESESVEETAKSDAKENVELNRIRAEDDQKLQDKAVAAFNEEHPGGFDDAQGVGHVGQATREDVEKEQAEFDQKLRPSLYKDLDRMSEGKPPIGDDGYPMELHHPDQMPGGVQEMTRTDHRLGENYKRNHPNGNSPSRIDRNEAARQRREYWKQKATE